MQQTTQPSERRKRRIVWFIRTYILGNKEAAIGFFLVLAFYLISIAVTATKGRLLPYDPIQQGVGSPFAPPNAHTWFGTDQLGRDLFSRILAATPNDALISTFVILVAGIFGGFLGALSGYKGGLIDEALMRVTDIFFAFPSLVLAMVIAVVLGPGLTNMMYALAIVWWPTYARLSRGEALKVSQYNYVESARISGTPTRTILLKHVLPNVIGSLLVYATLDIGTVVLTYSGLSYLGLAIQPPQPDWGSMVAIYQEYLIYAPWMPLFPGLVITLVVVSFSLFGDGLRAAQRRHGG